MRREVGRERAAHWFHCGAVEGMGRAGVGMSCACVDGMGIQECCLWGLRGAVKRFFGYLKENSDGGGGDAILD